jgi:hypothetical protein
VGEFSSAIMGDFTTADRKISMDTIEATRQVPPAARLQRSPGIGIIELFLKIPNELPLLECPSA